MRRPADVSSLALLQRRFFELVVAPEGVATTMAARGIPRAELEALVVGDARAGAVERLDVYANMYFFRIRDVLRDYFPKLAAVLGEAAFHDLVTDYLVAHPSTHPSLRYVGRALPAFVAKHRRGIDRPWLGELAALEWARLDVFDRADAVVLTREAVARLAPEAFADLALPLVPALEVVRTAHAVEETWREIEAGGAARAPEPAPPGHALLVWRRGVVVHHRPLGLDEIGGLEVLRAGGSFGKLCEMLGRALEPEEAAGLAAGLLGRWLADELLAARGG
jgi:hypothetical protein